MVPRVHIEWEVEPLIDALMHGLELVPDLRLLEEKLVDGLVALGKLVDSVLVAVLANYPVDRDLHGDREPAFADEVLDVRGLVTHRVEEDNVLHQVKVEERADFELRYLRCVQKEDSLAVVIVESLYALQVGVRAVCEACNT